MNIYIIGYTCSGKTTTGKRLAKKLGWNFLDLDKYIEIKHNKSINDIFDEFGEKTFREFEKQAVNDSLSLHETVIATGGGTPCFNNQMQILKENGICIYLKMNAKTLTSRITKSKQRPLFKNITQSQLGDFVINNLKEREFFYVQAHYIVDVLDIELINILVKLINKKSNYI